jgi:SGNH hydrolase-like domain, acetyltransferase AlgX
MPLRRFGSMAGQERAVLPSGGISEAAIPPGDARTKAPELIKRELRRAFIGFFTLCLVIPLLQTFYPIIRIVDPVEERRLPSPFPSPRLVLGEDGQFSTQLNNWFNDRVGLRDFFIRAKNQIDFTLFHTSRKVYIGRDGWLFLRGSVPPEPNAATLAALEERYLALARRLHDKGVQLVVVGYPDKSRVYPEKAPPDMPRPLAGGNYDRLRNFLAAQSALIFVDVQEIMERNKAVTNQDPGATLYYKTDPHPTMIGQIPVVKEVIERIARAEGRSDIRWDEKFTFAKGRSSYGTDARFMSLLFPPTESPSEILDYYDIGGKEPDGNWVIPDRAAFERADDGIGRPFDWEFRSRPELCPQRLPGMALFGNSSSDTWWSLGLHRYFCFSRRARNPISRFKLFYDTVPAGTKYFIFQYHEIWLTELLDDSRFLDGAPHTQ